MAAAAAGHRGRAGPGLGKADPSHDGQSRRLWRRRHPGHWPGPAPGIAAAATRVTVAVTQVRDRATHVPGLQRPRPAAAAGRAPCRAVARHRPAQAGESGSCGPSRLPGADSIMIMCFATGRRPPRLPPARRRYPPYIVYDIVLHISYAISYTKSYIYKIPYDIV